MEYPKTETSARATELKAELQRRAENGQRIMLTVQRRSEPRGETMRLCGKSGPKGRYVSFVRGDRYLGDFDASEVLRFLFPEASE